MARILIFGANGWIGSQLLSLFTHSPNLEWVKSSSVRCQNKEGLKQEFDDLQPTHVISCIGRTHGKICGVEIPTIDYLEEPGKLVENMTDNLYAPLLLAHLCNERSIHYTYMGTGCIFENNSEKSEFTESDLPNFFGSSYSIVKGITDQIMTLYPNTLNVRIRMQITAQPNSRDFITKILGYEKICSMPNSMTVLDELLPILVDMVLTKRTGTINLTNPGVISHEEILEMYQFMIDPSKKWKTMTYEEQSLLLKSKRSNNKLDTSLLKSWYPNVCDIHTAIRNTLEKRMKYL